MNFNHESPNFRSFCSTAVGFQDIVKDGKFKLAAGIHVEYIFMLIIQLSTKINLFFCTGSRFRDTVKKVKNWPILAKNRKLISVNIQLQL